jgi:hypothetical protein
MSLTKHLREGLKTMEENRGSGQRHFVVGARDFGVRPGIDLDTIRRPADNLEDDRIAGRLLTRQHATATAAMNIPDVKCSA